MTLRALRPSAPPLRPAEDIARELFERSRSEGAQEERARIVAALRSKAEEQKKKASIGPWASSYPWKTLEDAAADIEAGRA